MKALKISIALIFVINIILLAGCRENQSETQQAQPQTLVRTPQSSMGKAVGAAKNLSAEADARNSELDRQAHELAGE